MKFFSRDKLKVRSEFTDDEVKFYIDYNNIKNEDFTVKLLKEMISGKTCFVIVDTKLTYKEPKKDYDVILDELITEIEALSIKYKKIVVKTDEDMKIFGMPMRIDSKKKHKEYILGFIIDLAELKQIKHILNIFNVYYYLYNSEYCKEDLLDKLQRDYDKELSDELKYEIFDCNFNKHLAILGRSEEYDTINNIINKLK
ncbi:hypothetical protein M2651_02445 [Clostridium sp. SYSU_GA19001]|uniref:hypothetical protein n=1 Tax=Clostridium caldaquaticum TaxID=2940653 RepID=UPI0020776814|nr:hypothetical protein [Clostridium caldaquaticum]MCM8709882.1 hypothetical protein [Clostridium caldaquaticum]